MKSPGFGDFHDGLYAALQVTDPRVRRGSQDYLAQRILLGTCDVSSYLEIGWAEVGWRDDRRYIYTSQAGGSFTFFDQYVLTPNQTIYVQFWDPTGTRSSFDLMLWWNNQWNLLGRYSVPSGFGCRAEVMVDPYYKGTNQPFNFPRLNFGDGSSTGIQIADSVGNYRTWTPSTPTNFYSTDGFRHYGASFINQWYWGYAYSNNRPPTTSLSVTPTDGTTETTFRADLSASSDVNGTDPLTYTIHWGDGTNSPGPVATHKYATQGNYTITGTVYDGDAQSIDTETVEVCQDVSDTGECNSPPIADISVSPTAGDTNTVFSADLTGSDPDGDPITYEIDWGDGTTTPNRSGTHRYSVPGDYVITGTVTDSHGAQASDFADVKVCVMGSVCLPNPPVKPCADFDICPNPDPQTGPPGGECTTDCVTADGVNYNNHDVFEGDAINGYYVYISPGHFSTSTNPFPCPAGAGWSEWEEAWNSGRRMRDKLVSWDYTVMMPKKARDVGKTDVYRTRVETAYNWWDRKTQKDPARFAYVTIHSNAGSGQASCAGSPYGTQILYHNQRDLNVAAKLFNKLSPETPGGPAEEHRGPNYCTAERFEDFTQPNELCLQHAIEMPTAYMEVEFHDVTRGARWIHNNNDVAGRRMAAGVDCYMGKFGPGC